MSAVDPRTMLGRLGGAAPIGLAAFDRDMRFLTVNSWLARLNGYAIHEHVGRTLHEIVPTIADRIEDVVVQVLERRRPVYGVEMTRPHSQTGAVVHAEATFFPLIDGTGETVGVGCVVIDTTDRLLAIRRISLLQEAVNLATTAPDPTTAAQAIVERVLDAVQAQGVGIAFPSGDFLQYAAAAGPLGATVTTMFPRLKISDAHGPIGEAFRERRTVWCATKEDWQRQYPESKMFEAGARAVLAIPLASATGGVLGVLGVAFDHEAYLTEDDRDLVTAFTQQAAQALERVMLYQIQLDVRDRLALLASLGGRLDDSIEIEERVETFLSVVVPRFAGIASVELVATEEYTSPLREERVADGMDVAELELMTVPLVARGEVFGVVSFGRAQFTETDRDLARELVRRLAGALENARLYARERHIAETLQLSLLPRHIPAVDGVRLWARYLPGTDLVVGGDFWDVIELPFQRVLLVVGDVAGRGERAAVVMGRLRTIIQAESDEHDSPATLLHTLNRFLVEHEDEMATAICAVLDLTSGKVQLANAGHPPILRVTPAGETEYLGNATGLPLGVRPFANYTEVSFHLAIGDTLLLFTDGLVERRGEDIDDRFAELAGAAAEVATKGELWCDRVVERMIGRRRDDDVALLGVRYVGALTPELSIDCPAELVHLKAVRDRVRTWLTLQDATPDDVDAVLLAVGEAVANVAMHAYGARGGRLRVHGSLEDGVVHMRVDDDGQWRPPPDDLGRGMHIVEQMSDTVSVDARDDGTTVTFTRRLGAL
ncbi:MAG TPA: SpoIIE family protein phosphatase [Acidimicrobiia bacterium]|nr:SpoIIE family protein phosphatase [Acidimicrobiia bacterium]